MSCDNTLNISQLQNNLTLQQDINSLEFDQFQFIKGPAGSSGLPTPIQLQASTSGQTTYMLQNIITSTSTSWIEYCGVMYRAISNDYTISNDVLTIINPVIAPSMGDQFILVS